MGVAMIFEMGGIIARACSARKFSEPEVTPTMCALFVALEITEEACARSITVWRYTRRIVFTDCPVNP